MSKPKKDIVQVLDHTNAYMCTIELDRLRAALSHIGQHIVTEAEKSVLDACAAMTLCDDDPDAAEADPLEPQQHGDDCYIYTDDQYAIAKAELARRTP